MTNQKVQVREAVELLRQFYAAYGVEDEGPSHEFDLAVLPSELSIPSGDFNILKAVLGDATVRKQFGICREILEDLATRLTSEELLRELSGLSATQEGSQDDLANGIFWFSLAASLDQRQEGLPTTPLDGQVDLPLPLKIRMTIAGSLVLRLYLALVYMREGPLANLIERGAKTGMPCCGRVRKLLKADYVRRLRNSLSHGSFSMCVAGVAFRDDNGVIVATPEFLSGLCTCLMLIQLQALAAGTR